MARTKTTLNKKTLQDYLDGQHGVEGMLDREATDVLEAARGAAPVLSGDYRASLHIETDHTDRMAKRVVAGVDYAMKVEAEHGVLARAAR